MQGRESEREVVSALAALAGLPVDCAVLIRGGGSRTDLAAFDSRAIAEAIARAPFPVLTGLGHEIDQAIADLTAHTAFKTPTKVAEFLIERVARADAAVEDLLPPAPARGDGAAARRPRGAGAGRAGGEPGADAPERRRRPDRGARAHPGAARAGALCATPSGGGRPCAGGSPSWRPAVSPPPSASASASAERLAGAGRGKVREAAATLQGVERLCQQLAPERTLERGFSLTRDAAGRLVRQPAQVRPGDFVTTRVAGGDFKSRVEES